VSDAESALMAFETQSYDIIVTDIIMPRFSGIELLEKIREKSETVQVIIMTGEPTVETAIKAVQNGANDYLKKPIKKDDLLKAIRHAEQIKQLNDVKETLEKQNQRYQQGLETIVIERTTRLQKAMQGIISLLSSVVEARDPYTAGHQRRVGNLSAAIAEKMELGHQAVDSLRIAGYIHDVGKILIPIDILSKPGLLSPLETQMIRHHSFHGYEMLMNAELPDGIGETIYQHHERCDGSGYPRGIGNEMILPEAKILMVADVVEAMISHRPYRPALGVEAAMNEIKQNAGKLFDADVVKACLELLQSHTFEVDDSTYKVIFPI
jgi:putative nucleotidyltransferase with HDIG domain